MSVLEAVADAAHRFDVAAARPQLLAQADDLHVDRPVGDRIILPPDGVDDLVAGEDPAGAAGQEVQDAKFGKGQLDRLAPAPGLRCARGG